MIEIYTDASADGLHAVIGMMVYKDDQMVQEDFRIIKGIYSAQAELLAVAMAVSLFPDEQVHIYTDSLYVVNVLNKLWKIKKYKELWKTVIDLVERNNSIVTFVKGHDKSDRNNRVDRAVRTKLREARKG